MISIRLIGIDHGILDEFAEKVKEVAVKMGLKHSGPVKLPTKNMIIPYKRDFHETRWDTLNITLYKHLINIDGDERFVKQLSRIKVPDEVFIEVRIR